MTHNFRIVPVALKRFLRPKYAFYRFYFQHFLRIAYAVDKS